MNSEHPDIVSDRSQTLLPPVSRVSFFPEPPQCEPAPLEPACSTALMESSWPDEGGAAGQSPLAEEAADAAEFFEGVASTDRKSHRASLKADRSNAEGGVVIEMCRQPLLERTPVPGRGSPDTLISLPPPPFSARPLLWASPYLRLLSITKCQAGSDISQQGAMLAAGAVEQTND